MFSFQRFYAPIVSRVIEIFVQKHFSSHGSWINTRGIKEDMEALLIEDRIFGRGCRSKCIVNNTVKCLSPPPVNSGYSA